MLRSAFISILFTILLCLNISAQSDQNIYAANTTGENRTKEFRNLVKNSIIQNLSVDLSDSTEENWQSAFAAMQLLLYRSPWSDNRIRQAFDSIKKRSTGFQRSALELIYTLKLTGFTKPVNALLNETENSKLFAMSAEYLVQCNDSLPVISNINRLLYSRMQSTVNEQDLAVLRGLHYRISSFFIGKDDIKSPKELLRADYLKGNVIIYSIQRKNRNFPGIVIIKDTGGNFIKDKYGSFFAVPQLARSITNLPGYLTNGNTPQGLFRMDGFAVSKSSFIGPTENIQLAMPVETSIRHFFKDSSAIDSNWTKELYERLLPGSLKGFEALYQSFYAGMAGRTEIIAHGTTVNPDYYKDQAYYPLTPTQGCLATKELWNSLTGKRMESDQQKLINAVKAAGGADGYLIVFEIDDRQKAVSLDDIVHFLN